MSKIVDFSEVLITKFCHDLASTVGAINNGVEIMRISDDESLRNKAFEIISANAEQSVGKIKFYRFLYGIVKSEGEIDLSEIKQLTKEFFKDSKFEIVWHNIDSEGIVQLTAKAAKLLLNMIYIASCILITNGQIKIEIFRQGNGKTLTVSASGGKLKVPTDIDVIIKNKELMDIKLSNVQIHLTSKIASSLGVVLICNHSDESFTLSTTFA